MFLDGLEHREHRWAYLDAGDLCEEKCHGFLVLVLEKSDLL
jgi:hypothetical protein